MDNRRLRTRWITRTAILLALALVFQLGAFPQPVTGPIINMVLFLAAMIVGISSGVIIGILTPLTAFVTGILPPPLGPMIPFIAGGNALLVIVFGLLKNKNKYLGIGAGAVVKFLLLAAAVRLFIDVPENIARMMSLPQLLTALGGGVVFLIVYKALQVTDVVDLET